MDLDGLTQEPPTGETLDSLLEKTSDPADGRKVLLRCTAKGLEVIERMAPYSPPLGGRRGSLRMDFNEHQAVLANDRLGRPHPSRIQQYPPRDRQK